ncbi:MAG: hypothetical protein IPK03_14445 [Bacteroidetes bacterium]|nr:hypothetical protein [Bacteroidota bacterium]
MVFEKGNQHFSKGNDWILSGETPSYSEQYGDPCSGGVSYMTKLADGVDPIAPNPTQKQIADIAAKVGTVNINSYPIPSTIDQSSFSTSSTQNIAIDIVDVTGKTIAKLFNGVREAGISDGFDANKYGFDNRMLIAKVTVGDQVFSTTMVQVKIKFRKYKMKASIQYRGFLSNLIQNLYF